MKNKKKFKKELYDLLCAGGSLAVNQNGNPVSCYAISCAHCKMHSEACLCSGARKKWLESEYIEPEVDWSKVPIDTKVLVADSIDGPWIPRYFAGLDKKGTPLTWQFGRTSFTSKDKRPEEKASVWEYIKLYDKEDKSDED